MAIFKDLAAVKTSLVRSFERVYVYGPFIVRVGSCWTAIRNFEAIQYSLISLHNLNGLHHRVRVIDTAAIFLNYIEALCYIPYEYTVFLQYQLLPKCSSKTPADAIWFYRTLSYYKYSKIYSYSSTFLSDVVFSAAFVVFPLNMFWISVVV